MQDDRHVNEYSLKALVPESSRATPNALEAQELVICGRVNHSPRLMRGFNKP